MITFSLNLRTPDTGLPALTDLQAALDWAVEAGLMVDSVGRRHLSVSATPKHFEDLFGLQARDGTQHLPPSAGEAYRLFDALDISTPPVLFQA